MLVSSVDLLGADCAEHHFRSSRLSPACTTRTRSLLSPFGLAAVSGHQQAGALIVHIPEHSPVRCTVRADRRIVLARQYVRVPIRTHTEEWTCVVRPSPTREGCFRATTTKEGEPIFSEDHQTVKRAMAAAEADVKQSGHTCTAECSSW